MASDGVMWGEMVCKVDRRRTRSPLLARQTISFLFNVKEITMNDLETKIVESLVKIEDVLESMAPQAFNSLVEVAQIEGVMNLMYGGVFLVLFALCLRLFFYGFSLVDKYDAMDRHTTDKEEAVMIFSFGASVIGGFVSLVIALVSLTSTSTWLKLLVPASYVVKKLLAQ